MAEEDDAPPAIPEWEPGELAKRIASGHAHEEHFADLEVDELAMLVQRVIDGGQSKRYEGRTLYWDEPQCVVVLVNPHDPDGGTAFPTDGRYFDEWGR